MSSGAIKVQKAGTDENLADALTKGVDSAAIAIHVAGVGVELRDERHTMAPALEDSATAETKLEGE